MRQRVRSDLHSDHHLRWLCDSCLLRRTVSGVWLDSTDNTLCHCPNYEALPFDDPNEKDEEEGDGK